MLRDCIDAAASAAGAAAAAAAALLLRNVLLDTLGTPAVLSARMGNLCMCSMK